MFIERRALDDLPPDAILLDENEALQHLQTTILRWKPAGEVWALKYGAPILGGYNLLITVSTATYFFNRMRLPRAGLLFYYPMTAGTIAIFTAVLQQAWVPPAILLQKECVSCVYSKSLAIQLGAFAMYGVGGAFFVSAMVANHMHTYPVPGFHTWSDLKELGKLFVRFGRRIQPRITAFTCIGALFSYFIVNKQYSQFVSLNQKLFERDEELRKVAAEMRATKSKTP